MDKIEEILWKDPQQRREAGRCPHCGGYLDRGRRQFCPWCGKDLNL